MMAVKEILKDLVSINTIADKDNSIIMDYIGDFFLKLGFKSIVTFIGTLHIQIHICNPYRQGSINCRIRSRAGCWFPGAYRYSWNYRRLDH